MNQFTCKSCGGTYQKADPVHGSGGLCTQCQIAMGVVRLHDSEALNRIERLRSLEVVRRYGDAFSAVLEQILPSRRDPNYSKLVARDDYGHHLCPWCASPGFVMTQQLPDLRYRIACSAADCSAAPQLNWASTIDGAWQLWDTRK